MAPPFPCESSVSVKENPDRTWKVLKAVHVMPAFFTSKTKQIFKIERTSRSANKTIVTLEWRGDWWTTIWRSNYTRLLERSWIWINQFTHLKLTLMYLTLPQKYKLDDNHKTNINTFEVFSWIVSWWLQPHTTCSE